MTKRQKVINRLSEEMADRGVSSRDEVESIIDEIAFSDDGVELYLRRITEHSRKMLVTEVLEKVQRMIRHRDEGSPAERVLEKL